MKSEFSSLQIKGHLLEEQRVEMGWKLSKEDVHDLCVCMWRYMCVCGFRFVFPFISSERWWEVILMNGLQGCNLSLSMSRWAMTSSADLMCAALHVCLPWKKKHRLLGNAKGAKANTADGRWSEGWNRSVYKKNKKSKKKTIPGPPVCVWGLKMCMHAADIISVRPHQQAGPTPRAPRSLSHIIIWHRTPIICCA